LVFTPGERPHYKGPFVQNFSKALLDGSTPILRNHWAFEKNPKPFPNYNHAPFKFPGGKGGFFRGFFRIISRRGVFLPGGAV